ncbi:hypothetical protein Lal_00044150 [Lupinus albus]|nr:hypothetical protein Lal_00044150 [Lupinus albus]
MSDFSKRCKKKCKRKVREKRRETVFGQTQSYCTKSAATILFTVWPGSNLDRRFVKYGFDEVSSGCCGSGLIEASFMCNKISNVCSDPSKYVFWDSIHPTGKAYHHIFMASLPIIDSIISS